MTRTGFRRKPSKSLVIWTRSTRNGSSRKRFDENHLEKWANHCGFEFETTTRVDHERAEESRKQHRVVFTWGESDGETIEFKGQEWDFGGQKTPRTFIEIDGSGSARVKGWNFETVLNIREMRHKWPELLIVTASGEKKRLNGRKFVKNPRKRQRESK